MLNWIVLIEQIIYIKMDSVLNNLQGLICHETKKKKKKTKQNKQTNNGNDNVINSYYRDQMHKNYK